MFCGCQLATVSDNQDSNQTDKLERTIRHLDLENQKLRAKRDLRESESVSASVDITMHASKGSTSLQQDAKTSELISSSRNFILARRASELVERADGVVALQAELLATGAGTNKVLLRYSIHTSSFFTNPTAR